MGRNVRPARRVGPIRARADTGRVHAARSERDRCNAGPPSGPPGLFAGGATCFWAVTRVHNGVSNVLFGDGHVKSLSPDVYHSNTDHIDGSGNPVPAGAAPVAESIWREYWDTSYDVY